MERYAPTIKDLAPRDIVARSMVLRGPRGPRRRPAQGLRLPRPHPPGAGGARREAAGHHRVRPHLPRRRAVHRAGAGLPDRALRDGRHPDQRRTARCCATTPPSCRACTRPASAPASRCTARTGWAPTRCWTSTSSAGAPASPRPSTRRATTTSTCRRTRRRWWSSWSATACAEHGNERVADIRSELQAVDGHERGGVPHRGDAQAGADRHPRAEGALRPNVSVRTRASGSTPTCWRPSSWASCSTWPRSWSSARWPARSPAAATSARTSPTATTSTSCGTRWPTARDGDCCTDIRLDYKPVVQTRYQPMERKY